MSINTGVMESGIDESPDEAPLSRLIWVKIYYDPATQILRDGPRGYCLDVTNTTGKLQTVVTRLPDGTITTMKVGQGDPVSSGPPTARSRTASQMAQAGYVVREDVQEIAILGVV